MNSNTGTLREHGHEQTVYVFSVPLGRRKVLARTYRQLTVRSLGTEYILAANLGSTRSRPLGRSVSGRVHRQESPEEERASEKNATKFTRTRSFDARSRTMSDERGSEGGKAKQSLLPPVSQVPRPCCQRLRFGDFSSCLKIKIL